MAEEEEQFQSSNTCWICKKLIDDDDENVRDLCHITRKKIFLQLCKRRNNW